MGSLRLAFRALYRNPGLSTAVILSLALGIGANTAVFTALNAALFKPLPLAEPDRLVGMRRVGLAGGAKSETFSYPDYIQFKDQRRTFRDVAAFSDAPVNLRLGAQLARARGAAVSPNYFDVLGVAPVLGRAFDPAGDEIGEPNVAVISYDLWRRGFSADALIIGKSLHINGREVDIIGVAPNGFTGSRAGQETAVWTTLAMWPALEMLPRPLRRLYEAGSFDPMEGGYSWLSIVARLHPRAFSIQLLT